MAVSCIVCGDKTKGFNKSGVDVKNCFAIIVRYLNLNPDVLPNTLINLPINTLINNVQQHRSKTIYDSDSEILNVCGSCSPIVTNFLDTYQSWICLQLQLNWRLQQIVELMKNLDHNRDSADENIPPEEKIENEWTRLREMICSKVETNSKKEFPYLKITKVPETETEPVIKQECLNFDENTESDSAFLTDHEYDQEDAAGFGGGGDDNYVVIKEENSAVFQNHSDEVQPTPNENLATGKRYSCKFCKPVIEFRYYGELRLHLNNHHGVQKPHLCPKCGKSFAKKSSLISHDRSHTGEKPFKCQFCPKAFAYDSLLIVHERIHRNEKLFKCSVCSKGFNDRNSCKRHVRQVHGLEPSKVSENIIRSNSSTKIIKPLKCSYSSCERRFINRQSRRRHERTHRGGEFRFCCRFCSLGFPRYFELLEHERSHRETGSHRNFECGVCKKRFSKRIRCRLHLEKFHQIKDSETKIIKINKDIDATPGPETEPLADNIETLSPLLENHHDDEHVEYRYICKICGPETKFQYFDEFLRHKKFHRGAKPYLCGTCGKGFARNDGLIKHNRVHSGDKPYKCQFCGKGFAQDSTLRDHEQIHINKRPFCCSVCKKGFNWRTACRRHLREVHQMKASEACKNVVKISEPTPMSEFKVGKPLQCRHEACDRRFINDQSRKRHERTHKDTPYQCGFCQMGFSSYYQFRAHEKGHRENLKGKTLKCGLCGKKFARKVRCKNHLQKDHHLLDDDDINKLVVKLFVK